MYTYIILYIERNKKRRKKKRLEREEAKRAATAEADNNTKNQRYLVPNMYGRLRLIGNQLLSSFMYGAAFGILALAIGKRKLIWKGLF